MSSQDLEKKRKNIWKILWLGLLCLFFIPPIVASLVPSGTLSSLVLWLVLLLTVVSFMKARQEFTSAYKAWYVKKPLEATFSKLSYQPEAGLDKSCLIDLGMIDENDRYKSGDRISGLYKDVELIASDVFLLHKIPVTVKRSEFISFRGKWMIFDFHKPFKSNMQVWQKDFEYANSMNWSRLTNFQKVSMENDTFNQMFSVCAQDEHDAFYILTPPLMERIVALADSTHSKILLSFVGNKMHVGLETSANFFEISIFSKVDEAKIAENVSKDIKLITDFVDFLHLDRDFFGKDS